MAGVTNYTAGNYITPSSGALVSIIQVQPIRVRFSISTSDFMTMFGSLDELKKNGRIRLRLANGVDYPDEGKIELINNEANNRTDAIQIFASFPNSDFRLFVGSTVRVTLARREGKMLPAVPSSALMHDADGSYVYVVKDGNVVEKRSVVPGNATETSQLIVSGLVGGETVVVSGTHKTVPGGVVEPIREK